MNILIIGTHQTYLKANAGGYVRLREFIKRFPSEFNYKVIDVRPSIYEDIVEKDKLILFNNPRIVKLLLTLFFPLGVLCERVWVAFCIYKLVKRNIINGKSLIYMPLGEFLHMYLPAVILKKQFPQSKLLLDMLNFGVVNDNIFQITRKLKKKTNILTSFGLASFYLIAFSILKNTINKVDYIFTVSKEQMTEVKKIYRKNTIGYIPPGVSIDTPIRQVKRKKYSGVYVGRVTEAKGIYNLLEVWKEVIKEKPQAKLAIAGFMDPVYSRTIMKRIEKYGLEKNIIVFGTVTEDEKYKILSESEIFLHLANFEPCFPCISILEGFSIGLPVIVYNMKEVTSHRGLKDKGCVFIVRNGDIRMTAEQIIRYNSLTKFRKQVINKKAINYAKLFDWNILAKKEFSIIRDIVK